MCEFVAAEDEDNNTGTYEKEMVKLQELIC